MNFSGWTTGTCAKCARDYSAKRGSDRPAPAATERRSFNTGYFPEYVSALAVMCSGDATVQKKSRLQVHGRFVHQVSIMPCGPQNINETYYSVFRVFSTHWERS